jgi:uncharacterized protein (DUF1015 family)
VPRFEPFAALRYSDDLAPLEVLTAPPYDVLSGADRAALARTHEANFVVIDLPVDDGSGDRYGAAADTLRRWCSAGIMTLDSRPSFTLYRMSFTDESGRHRNTVGVIGALEVVDEGSGGVLPHERTTPKAKTDRLDLTRATHANLSPVWGLSTAEGLTHLLTEPGEALGSLTVDGVTHTVERVDDPYRVAAISSAVASGTVVIADGHHRYAIARTYRDEVRASTGRTDSSAELTMTYVGELIEDQLSIDAIHRLYSGTTAATLLGQLSASFELAEAGPIDPGFAALVVQRNALCFVDAAGNGTWLTPIPQAFEGVRALDGALLEHALTGIDAEVSYQHGVQNVIDMVGNGSAAAGVLIRPTSIAEIRRTVRDGTLMPPKSTFFTPKLRSGLVVRPL